MDGHPDSKILIKQPSTHSIWKRGGGCFTRRMDWKYVEKEFKFYPN